MPMDVPYQPIKGPWRPEWWPYPGYVRVELVAVPQPVPGDPGDIEDAPTIPDVENDEAPEGDE